MGKEVITDTDKLLRFALAEARRASKSQAVTEKQFSTVAEAIGIAWNLLKPRIRNQGYASELDVLIGKILVRDGHGWPCAGQHEAK